jgi:polyhydroxyalkanoate synthesis regulator phasin
LKREEGAAKEAVKSAKLVLDNALTELLNKLDTQKKYAEQTTQAKKTLIELGQHNVKRKIGDEMDSLRSRITVIERRIANLP